MISKTIGFFLGTLFSDTLISMAMQQHILLGHLGEEVTTALNTHGRAEQTTCFDLCKDYGKVWDDTPEVTESKTPFDILARQMVNESRRGIHSLVVSSWDDVLQPHPAGILKASASGYPLVS